jgi:hypothetical protein
MMLLIAPEISGRSSRGFAVSGKLSIREANGNFIENGLLSSLGAEPAFLFSFTDWIAQIWNQSQLLLALFVRKVCLRRFVWIQI